MRSGVNASQSGERQQMNIEHPQYRNGPTYSQFTPTSQGTTNSTVQRSAKARNSQMMVNQRYYDRTNQNEKARKYLII